MTSSSEPPTSGKQYLLHSHSLISAFKESTASANLTISCSLESSNPVCGRHYKDELQCHWNIFCFGTLNEEEGSATADTYLKYESPPKYRVVKNNPEKTLLGHTNLWTNNYMAPAWYSNWRTVGIAYQRRLEGEKLIKKNSSFLSAFITQYSSSIFIHYQSCHAFLAIADAI